MTESRPPGQGDAERDGLARVGHLLGLLWLREVDRSWAHEFGDPHLGGALAELGLALPELDDDRALNELAASYFEEMVHPTSRPPPVHSLVAENKYEGRASGGVREVAAALGVDLDRDASRSAPPDHLGSELTLWAELVTRSPESAAGFAAEFLRWAPSWCRRHAPSVPGFYGHLFAVTADFIDTIVEPATGTRPGR